MSEQRSIRDEVVQVIGAYLSGGGEDFETGPFSDTSFVRAEAEKDGSLSLFDSESEEGWPIGSFDIPQLVEWLLASPVIRRIQAETIRDARRKLNEHLLNAHGAGYSDYGLQFLHQEADRIERGE